MLTGLPWTRHSDCGSSGAIAEMLAASPANSSGRWINLHSHGCTILTTTHMHSFLDFSDPEVGFDGMICIIWTRRPSGLMPLLVCTGFSLRYFLYNPNIAPT